MIESINDLEFTDSSDLKVVYVQYVGKNSDGLNVYQFLLSENTEDTFAEDWAENRHRTYQMTGC